MSRKSMIWGLSALELAGVRRVLGARADQKEKRALRTRLGALAKMCKFCSTW